MVPFHRNITYLHQIIYMHKHIQKSSYKCLVPCICFLIEAKLFFIDSSCKRMLQLKENNVK